MQFEPNFECLSLVVVMSATWDTFFPSVKSKTVPAFRHKQIPNSHHHETHFYTILKYFRHLKRNHTNHNHLYSSPLNYTYTYTSISIQANYNNLYAPLQIYNYKKKFKKLGHFFLRREIQKLSQLLDTSKFHHPITMRLIFIPF